MANDLDLTINRLSLESGLDRNTLSIALRRSETYLTRNIAEMADHYIFADAPGFTERWERRVRLTFDPSRMVTWQRIGIDTNDLLKIFQIADPAHCWRRITGELWMTESQWLALTDWVLTRPTLGKELRDMLTIGSDEYRLREPLGSRQPKIKVLRPSEITPREKTNAS